MELRPNNRAGVGESASLIKQFLAVLVVVFLLFSPYISRLMVPETRRCQMWQPSDPYVLVGTIVIIALASVIIGQLVRMAKRPLLNRFVSHLFVIAFGAGLLANLWYNMDRPVGYRISQFGMEMRTIWLVLFVVVGYSIARPASKLVLRCQQVCFITFPVMLIVLGQLFCMPTHPSSRDPLPDAPESNHIMPVKLSGMTDGNSPVYLFIFDAWSYSRSMENGEIKTDFRNLHELSQQSIIFQDAHSPADRTSRSIPRLLYQTDDPVMESDGRMGFRRNGEFVNSRDCKSIYSIVADRHYRTFLVGFTLPYPLWLGDNVDVCRTYCRYARGNTLLTNIGAHAFEAAYYWTDPWSSFLYKKLKPRIADAPILKGYRDMKNDILNVISHQPSNTFAVFHYPLPHYPYIVDKEGDYLGPDGALWYSDSVEGYQRNLACMDRQAGEFIAAMKKTGKFDNALIIMTGDHTWRYDPAHKENADENYLTHVPLIVKLPNQRRALSIDSRYETYKLGQLIAQVLNNTEPEGVRQLVSPMPSGADGLILTHSMSQK